MTDKQAIEIRSILHKNLARGLNVSDCLVELQSIFGEECPSREMILHWYEAITLDNVESVKKLIKEDPKVTCRQIEARLNIGGPVVRSIVRDRLGLRKIGNRWVKRKSEEENGDDKNADVSNGICVKLENDFQVKIEVEDIDLPETNEKFDEHNTIAMCNDAEIKCAEETSDMKTPVIEDFTVKKEVVDEDLEHNSDDLTYLCMGNTIKEESIDIFDEHIESDAQIKQENVEFSERIETPNNGYLEESKDELQKKIKKKIPNIDVKSAIILTSDNRYACKNCNKSYKHSFHAYRHVSQRCQISKGRFECKKCGRNFIAKDSLKRHELFLHIKNENLQKRKNDEDNFICQKCNRKYRDKDGLRRHEKLECGKEPRFACAHCDYRTLHKINLVRHFARNHAELAMTRISCPKCDKSYKNECTLKRHLQLECGKEPAFACDMCSFRTKRKSCLASHVQNKHLNKKKRA